MHKSVVLDWQLNTPTSSVPEHRRPPDWELAAEDYYPVLRPPAWWHDADWGLAAELRDRQTANGQLNVTSHLDITQTLSLTGSWDDHSITTSAELRNEPGEQMIVRRKRRWHGKQVCIIGWLHTLFSFLYCITPTL